jgi:HD-like signal output (HDOD) protein
MGFLENDDASLRRLTTLILNDYGLLLMVMRTANSVRYNRSGKRICSVTHAVALLGVNTIRNLASGLHFLEHYRGRSAGLTELILLSTLTAAHAHRIANMLGCARSEEAALCGMFMNLGEVLIASHVQDRYRMIRHRTKECSWTDRQACIRELGFTYEDLGQAMASYWRLPASVGDAMRSVDDWMHELDPERRLFSAITAFSHELTNAVYRNEQEQNAGAAVAALVGWYGETLRLEPDDVRRLLTDGISDTKQLFAALKIQLDDLRLLRQSGAAVATAGNAEASAPPGNGGANLIERLENELSVALLSESPIDVNQALMMALEAIYRGGPFDRVLLCLASADLTEIRGRLGLGDGVEEAARSFRLQLGSCPDPVASALLSKQDLFISGETGSASLRASEPIRTLQPACFGLYPLVIDGRIVGCLYFDRVLPLPLSSPAILKSIGRIRDAAASALARNRPSGSNQLLSGALP